MADHIQTSPAEQSGVPVPLVSVYCLAYNHAKTIAQAIEGVIRQQTDFAFELIIHDDASTDGTRDIIARYAKQHPSIIRPIFQDTNQFHDCNLFQRYVHPLSCGKYIAICDGDDYWIDPCKLQMQVDYMTENPECSLCFHAIEQLSAGGKKTVIRQANASGSIRAQKIIRRGGLFCPTSSCLFRRDVMDAWPRFRCMADVYDYPAQILAATMGDVYYIDRVMAVYRYASHSSWTARHDQNTDYEHLLTEERWLNEFNRFSDGRYIDAVHYHLAHMWFMEYRKNADPDLALQVRRFARRLPLHERAMFSLLLIFYQCLGTRANAMLCGVKKVLRKFIK